MSPRLFRFPLSLARLFAATCGCGAIAATPNDALTDGPLSDTWQVPQKLNPTLLAVVGAANCSVPERIRINEVSFRAGPGHAHWIELLNDGDTPANLAGNTVRTGGGAVYVIPGALSSVPSGGFVAIYFDGLGSGADDYDFGDGAAVLHTTGVTNPFTPIDETAVYSSASFSPDTIRAFVAWGDLPAGLAVNDAIAAGLWLEGDFVAPEAGGPGLDTTVDDDGSTGLFGEADASDVSNWIVYSPARTTPADTNLAPAPELRSPTTD